MTKQIALVALSLLAIVLAATLTLIFGVALWDTGPVQTLQGVGSGVEALMQFFTFLGSEIFFLLLVPLVYWCINKSLGADMGVLLTFSGVVNGLLKSFLKHPRPFWSNPTLQLSDAVSFSLPSGHAQNSTVVFGYLALWLAGKENKAGRKSGARWLWVVFLILLILLVSISRAYLGVHYPGDILWGCAIGVLIITLYAWLKPRALPWLRKQAIGTHVVLAVVASVAVLGAEALLLSIPFGTGQTFGGLYVDASRRIAAGGLRRGRHGAGVMDRAGTGDATCAIRRGWGVVAASAALRDRHRRHVHHLDGAQTDLPGAAAGP